MVVSLIPIVDTVCDLRDLCANIRQYRKDPANKITLFFIATTAIGFVPELGTVVKSALRLVWVYLKPLIKHADDITNASKLITAANRACGAALPKIAAARECEETMTWFGTLAISRQVGSFGRNNQIFDTSKALARDFRRGADMAALGDYKPIWDTARCVSGDVRGMMEQPLHSWMTEAEYREFSYVRVSRLLAYAGEIESALNNAMVGADSFFDPDPDCPERSQDDDGFPGDKIVETYNAYINRFNDSSFPRLPDSLPEYVIDRSIVCRTGDEVPWTGVWYPSTGVERRSLAFAIKGLRMQPAYPIIKTIEELESESDGVMFFSPQTVAEATMWHPMIPSGLRAETDQELRAKAGEPCPKAGIWQPMDPGAPTRAYEAGETMVNFGSAYGITVWQWIAGR